MCTNSVFLWVLAVVKEQRFPSLSTGELKRYMRGGVGGGVSSFGILGTVRLLVQRLFKDFQDLLSIQVRVKNNRLTVPNPPSDRREAHSG